MNLLVSDFDGTIYFKDDLDYTYENLLAIKEFMKENQFCIATGRSFYSLKEQIDRFSIEYDYLICNNGNILLDNNNQIISSIILDKCLVRELVTLLRTCKYVNKIKLLDMLGKKTNNFFEVVEIVIYGNNLSKIAENKELQDLLKNISYRLHLNKLYIKDSINKKDGIDCLSKIISFPKKDIYVIGDNCNDLEMILGYDGYAVSDSDLSHLEPQLQSSKVHELIRKKLI